MGLSPLAARLLSYLQSARKRDSRPIPWQTIAEQAAKSNIRLVKEKIVALANEIRSHGYPIHETKNHEFYLGEPEMFEGQIDPREKIAKQFEDVFDAVRM